MIIFTVWQAHLILIVPEFGPLFVSVPEECAKKLPKLCFLVSKKD
jgi:hypothetical protein